MLFTGESLLNTLARFVINKLMWNLHLFLYLGSDVFLLDLGRSGPTTKTTTVWEHSSILGSISGSPFHPTYLRWSLPMQPVRKDSHVTLCHIDDHFANLFCLCRPLLIFIFAYRNLVDGAFDCIGQLGKSSGIYFVCVLTQVAKSSRLIFFFFTPIPLRLSDCLYLRFNRLWDPKCEEEILFLLCMLASQLVRLEIRLLLQWVNKRCVDDWSSLWRKTTFTPLFLVAGLVIADLDNKVKYRALAAKGFPLFPSFISSRLPSSFGRKRIHGQVFAWAIFLTGAIVSWLDQVNGTGSDLPTRELGIHPHWQTAQPRAWIPGNLKNYTDPRIFDFFFVIGFFLICDLCSSFRTFFQRE